MSSSGVEVEQPSPADFNEEADNIETTRPRNKKSWPLDLTKRLRKNSKGVVNATPNSQQLSSLDDSTGIFQRRTTSSVSSAALLFSGHALTIFATAAQFTPVPYLATLASITSSICNTIQSAQDNKDSLKQLASTVVSLSSTVIDTYHRLHPNPATEGQESESFSKDPTLNQHVERFIDMLKEIEDFVKSHISRKFFQRVVSSRSDLNVIQDYKEHLKKALDAFMLQSNITLRETVFKMASQQENIISSQETVRSALVSLQDLIRSNATGQGQTPQSETNGEASSPDRFFSLPAILPETTEMVGSPVDINNEPFGKSIEAMFSFSLIVEVGQTHDTRDCSNGYESSEASHSHSLQSNNPFVNLSTSSPSRPLSSFQLPRPQSHSSPQAATTNPFENVFNKPAQGNINVKYISGDYVVNSNVDNSRRENFGNVYTGGGLMREGRARGDKEFIYNHSRLNRVAGRRFHHSSQIRSAAA
ncbi:hypothetical protein F5890DRAFT_1556812 [Lentinula detonsa]|uniref:Uncharacterized protein n=1 Tax=Lentinula detonsa TaxID=2804962 RepID=A0AA38PTB6_9AGAR|nr:hypothetical protein F5890DRAFT_1556812 [Lentinula detonsa]